MSKKSLQQYFFIIFPPAQSTIFYFHWPNGAHPLPVISNETIPGGPPGWQVDGVIQSEDKERSLISSNCQEFSS